MTKMYDELYCKKRFKSGSSSVQAPRQSEQFWLNSSTRVVPGTIMAH